MKLELSLGYLVGARIKFEPQPATRHMHHRRVHNIPGKRWKSNGPPGESISSNYLLQTHIWFLNCPFTSRSDVSRNAAVVMFAYDRMVKFRMPLYWVLLSLYSLLPTTNIIALIKFPCSSRDFHRSPRHGIHKREQLQGHRAKHRMKGPEKCESFEMRGKPGMKQEGNK